MAMVLKVKHSGAYREVEVPSGADPYACIGRALSLPPGRIKLIRNGKVLPPAGSSELFSALQQPGTLLVLSSEPLPGRGARLAAAVRESAWTLWMQATPSNLQFAAIYAVTWLWSCLMASGRAAIAFVSSAVVAPEVRERRRD